MANIYNEAGRPAVDPDKVWKAANLMRMIGGSFARAIGEAALCADSANKARLVAAFPELFERYDKLAREEVARVANAFPDVAGRS